MRKIRDVLRLHLKGGLSQRQIAAALGISKGVVAKYISLASELGLRSSCFAAITGYRFGCYRSRARWPMLLFTVSSA